MFSQVQSNSGSWDFATNRIIKAPEVVNDHAKCVVAVIHEYSGLITRDKMQLQFLLQVVEDQHKMYPDSRKKDFVSHLQEQ